MDFAMVSATEGDGELIADLASKRQGLRKSEMVGIGKTSSADETSLLGNRFDMFTVANSTGRW
jgi:hypothetical protein